MEYYAHSGVKLNGIAPQYYDDHIRNGFNKAWEDSNILSPFLRKAVLIAILYHDMGKLDPENQKVLCKKDKSNKLPINHVDCGVGWCINEFRQTQGKEFIYAAYFIHAHHIGLLDQSELFFEKINLINLKSHMILTGGFRDENISEFFDMPTRDRVDSNISELNDIHYSMMRNEIDKTLQLTYYKDNVDSYDIRMAFSIMVDADHSDTARHYGCPFSKPPLLLPDKRLDMLNSYVESLSSNALNNGISKTVVRSRNELYKISSECDVTNNSFFNVPAPTGKGKTVSMLNLALRIAEHSKAERIFLVIPFINIISQSVKVYRESIVEHNEFSDEVVNEIHSKVEFDDFVLRKYSQQWNSPINATTSVQFFNSLFSNKPSEIRKIHHYANSVVILDEYHISVPDNLWKVTLEALKHISEKYNIKFIFSTGSEKRYWDEIFATNIDITEVLSTKIKEKFSGYERQRFRTFDCGILNDDVDFYKLFMRKACIRGQLKHDTMIVANTIANAVFIYDHFKNNTNWQVFHLSSCIAPAHRETILKKINILLKLNKKILLVATSIVECGIDFSFGMGFRETASMSSMIQFGGRINRNREKRKSTVYEWAFSQEWIDNSDFSHNPRLSREIYVRDGVEVNSNNCTQVTADVVIQNEADRYVINEKNYKFNTQNSFYQVIEDRTVTVLIDKNIAKKITDGIFVPPFIINRNSVSIYRHKITKEDGEDGPWAHLVTNFGDDIDNSVLLWVGNYSHEYGIFAEFVDSEVELLANENS